MIHPGMPIVTPEPVDFPTAARRWLKTRPHKVRPDHELDALIVCYEQACAATGVSLELAITQMVHETDSYTSLWAQPPRRNPAGMGVTGTILPDGTPAGQWFDTDALGVTAHIGRLLAYLLPAGEGSGPQRRFVDYCLTHQPKPPRAVATNVAEMAAVWAADPDYVSKLTARHAQIAAA